jgi:thiamine biosynthesis lipoprotein
MPALPEAIRQVGWSAPAMGGTLNVSVFASDQQLPAAQRSVRLAGQRVRAWANRLTRFDSSSDLSRLNAQAIGFGERATEIRPTLAAVLGWAALAAERSSHVVDVTLLDARLAAETGAWTAPVERGVWVLEPYGRQAIIVRPSGVRFDLDGVAKGWLADRAADLLDEFPGVAVDADGDISLRAGPGVVWQIEVVDPRGDDRPPLATMQFIGGEAWSRAAGVATSATTVHRWTAADGSATHHLIDPRTRRSADTDVVQATVVAPTAREAEMLAKTALILGSQAALPLLVASAAQAAILLLDTGELLALPGTEAWLA